MSLKFSWLLQILVCAHILLSSACKSKYNAEVRANTQVEIPQASASAYLSKYSVSDKRRNKLMIFGAQWTVERLVIDSRVEPAQVSMELVLNGYEARSYISKKSSNIEEELSKAIGAFLESDEATVIKTYNFP